MVYAREDLREKICALIAVSQACHNEPLATET